MIVRTSDPDYQIRHEGIERCGERGKELFQIHLALDVANGFDVHRAVEFAVLGVADMDRIRKNSRIALEDGISAIALMSIGIDHHDLDIWLPVLQIANGGNA